jgi:hypothetical protein
MWTDITRAHHVRPVKGVGQHPASASGIWPGRHVNEVAARPGMRALRAVGAALTR